VLLTFIKYECVWNADALPVRIMPIYIVISRIQLSCIVIKKKQHNRTIPDEFRAHAHTREEKNSKMKKNKKGTRLFRKMFS
jgi:uncharacterized membrane protein